MNEGLFQGGKKLSYHSPLRNKCKVFRKPNHHQGGQKCCGNLTKSNDYQVSDPSRHVETAPFEGSGFGGDKKYCSQENPPHHIGGSEGRTARVVETVDWRDLYFSQSFKFLLGVESHCLISNDRLHSTGFIKNI